MDEGVIKFDGQWTPAPPIDESLLKELNHWRTRLCELGLIGIYSNGIAFGNISQRSPHGGFIISGTQTGGLRQLEAGHYTHVVEYSISKNWVHSKGPIQASSESLTHAMIYEMDLAIQAVIHVHHKVLWKNLIHQVPTTSPLIPYGTPETAYEVKRLYENTRLKAEKILVMGGHTEGIISFGTTLDEAARILLNHLENMHG